MGLKSLVGAAPPSSDRKMEVRVSLEQACAARARRRRAAARTGRACGEERLSVERLIVMAVKGRWWSGASWRGGSIMRRAGWPASGPAAACKERIWAVPGRGGLAGRGVWAAGWPGVFPAGTRSSGSRAGRRR